MGRDASGRGRALKGKDAEEQRESLGHEVCRRRQQRLLRFLRFSDFRPHVAVAEAPGNQVTMRWVFLEMDSSPVSSMYFFY